MGEYSLTRVSSWLDWLRIRRLYPGVVLKPALRTVLVPFPTTARIGGQSLSGSALLTWASDLVRAVLLDSVRAAATVASGDTGTTRADET